MWEVNCEVFFFQMNGLCAGSQQHERGTQTEEKGVNKDWDQQEAKTTRTTRGDEPEMVNGGSLLVLVKNKREGNQEEEEMVVKGRRRCSTVTLSKSFSRLLSFRRVKK